ncbi:MAG: hypothetical protein Kow00111_03510 [Thermincola ferriacetica]
MARPAIAEYRIIKYDGQNVRFWYEDHNTGKREEVELSALEFIGKLVMHIPPKYFKMVRRYGLYQPNKNNQAQKIVSLWNYVKSKDLMKTRKIKNRKLTWKERIRKEFGENPIACPKCGNEMELWTIWDPKYGYLYDISKDGPEVKGNEQGNKRRDGLVRQSAVRRREPGEYYNYHCKRCKYEEGVPGFVVDEFAMGEDLKPGELPGVVCPKCNGDMEWTGETYFEEI